MKSNSMKSKPVKRLPLVAGCVVLMIPLFAAIQAATVPTSSTFAQESKAVADADEKSIQRSRDTVAMLDNIFKQTIVLITDKYVHDEDDFAAGSAAVLLFKNVSESSENNMRLIDATGDPYETENVAKDDFEKKGIKLLKSGAKGHEQVITKDGKPFLRALTPVPVVMQKCVMCHAHYEDVKKGEPIGAISYTIPIK